MLDPNPLNELGKGTLDPAVEAKLLARGIVFAQTVMGPNGKTYLRTACRPIMQCYADAIRSFQQPRVSRGAVASAPDLAIQ